MLLGLACILGRLLIIKYYILQNATTSEQIKDDSSREKKPLDLENLKQVIIVFLRLWHHIVGSNVR